MAEDFADLKKKMARRYGQPPDEATDNMAPAPELEQPVPSGLMVAPCVAPAAQSDSVRRSLRIGTIG